MLVDELERLRERAGLFEETANLGEHGWCRFSGGNKLFQFAPLVIFEPFERKRPEHGRPAAQYIAAQRQLIEVVAAPILQIVQNLETDAEMFREPSNGLFILRGRPYQP